MSAAFDMSYCETCKLRGAIGPDELCAREALGFANAIAETSPLGAFVLHEEVGAVEYIEPGEVPFGDFFSRAIAHCIDSVRNGGPPISAGD